jgi:hypothetical protein
MQKNNLIWASSRSFGRMRLRYNLGNRTKFAVSLKLGEYDRFQYIIIGSSINFKYGIRELTQSSEPKETETFALSVYDFPLDTLNEFRSGITLIQLSSVNWLAYWMNHMGRCFRCCDLARESIAEVHAMFVPKSLFIFLFIVYFTMLSWPRLCSVKGKYDGGLRTWTEFRERF